MTASGWIALLQEDDVALRRLALEKLLECVDVLWSEVAEALPDLEAMAEDDVVAGQPLDLARLAAAVASRVFFHLQEPTQALRLALAAGPQYFNPISITDDAASAQSSPASAAYVQRLVAAALDAYVAAAAAAAAEEDGGSDPNAMDETTTTTATTMAAAEKAQQQQQQQQQQQLPQDQLQAMVDRLLETSCQAGNHAHALGMALEARQVHKVKYIVEQSGYDLKLLQHAIYLATNVVSSKSFRNETLQVIAECLHYVFAQNEDEDEHVAMATAPHLILVHQLLHQHKEAAQVLTSLLTAGGGGNDDDTDDVSPASLLGLQLCFDLMDSGDQAFVTLVANEMPREFNKSSTTTKRLEQAQRILVGGFSAELALSFLHKQSHADRLILENLKRALEERSSGSSRNSVLHTAAVLTHAYLYAGTTNDSFLRDYLDWMKKASNWAKFSATASLGVIHAAHISEAMHLLQPYLPKLPEVGEDVAISPTGGYAEGGSLYALGLIHGANAGSSAEKRAETTQYLRSHLRISHTNEVISHGAALGVGLTAMGSADVTIVQELKQVLDTDSAVAGEAAGMAIGMVLVGTGAGNTTNALPAAVKEELAEVVVELKNYARVTQHEKIIRGIAMGLALINFGQEENADTMIEEMRSDRDPVMRYGAQYALALAYCGTGSNKAIRILLHTAVSDVSDDVRMAAVLGLAFVLFKTPQRVPDLVKLLLESFNPNVRYASCMAVGIAMAGTGDAESIAMLEPMLDDMTDYVRQGALMGTSMIYMQQSDGGASAMAANGGTTTNPQRGKLRAFREKLATIVTEKHQSMLTKMGAILSTGIIDAGGRNFTISLNSRNGFTKMSSAVGIALWLQHWHWYPMMHMLSLAFTPTFTIGLNKDLKYPKANSGFEIICNAKPSMFAYPKKLEEKKEEKKKRVETVTLSTTSKEKARLARKRAKGGRGSALESTLKDAAAAAADDKKEGGAPAADEDAMDVDTANKEGTKDEKPSEGGEVAAAATVTGTEKKKKRREPEPLSFRIGNPARITKAQSEYCEFDLSQRYRPIRPNERPFGVIVLTDSTPNEEEDVGAVVAPSLEPEGELAPPEPFEWTPTAALIANAENNTTTAKKSDEKDGEDEDHKDENNDKSTDPSSTDDGDVKPMQE
ncbi:hypothetical protein ACA910_001104 [Epithemia clementina (nom. ined.)]